MMPNSEFLAKLNDSLSRNDFIVFSAHCTIRYSGRAESYLPFGDRLVIIKHDGTMLVHQPNGQAPVNYMKERTSHSAKAEHEEVLVKSSNLQLKEFMDIAISHVHFFHSHKLEDNHKIMLAGSERDMSEMIMANPELIERGFVPFSAEEHTKYGFIDVFGHDKEGNTVVVECKRYSVGLDAVTQLRRYVEKIKASRGITNVRGILAAPKITPNAERMLNDWGFSFRKVEPPKYLEQYNKSQMSIFEYDEGLPQEQALADKRKN